MTLTSHNKRWITAVIGLPILALCLYIGSWAVFIILLLASCLGQLEFYTLFWPKNQRVAHKALGVLLGVLLLFLSMTIGPAWAMLSLVALAWVLNMFFLFRYSGAPTTTGYAEPSVLMAGMLYVPAVLQFAFHLQPLELILVLLACFASDTGAFYVGSWFGSRKVWPEISPKKTWIGSLGGLALCVFITAGMGLIAGDSLWADPMWGLQVMSLSLAPSIALWVVLGVFLNLFAQFGDFFESALKRSRDIKDSGSLLPGHGGLLDRIDSILFALPGYVLFKVIYCLW